MSAPTFSHSTYLLTESRINLITESGDFLITEAGSGPVNTGATTYGGRNSICQRSGWKARPQDLVKDWTGLWVLPQFKDIRNPQDFQKTQIERDRGSVAAERTTDEFITISEAILTEDGKAIEDEQGGIWFTENIPVTL